MGVSWHEWGDLSGDALVFLHGFLGDGSDWAAIAAEFPQYRCLAPNLPGHGQTEIADGLGWSELVIQLSEGLKSKGIHRAIVIGYSLGGRIALHWAQSHPDLIQGIILESASPGIDSDIERRARRVFDLQVEQRLRSMAPPAFIDWWCGLPMFGGIKSHPNYPVLREKRSRYSAEAMIRVLYDFGPATQPSVWPTLGQLPIIGFVTGASDIKYRDVAYRIQAEFPDIPVEILEKVAHNCHFEAPDRFSMIVHQFLRANPHLG